MAAILPHVQRLPEQTSHQRKCRATLRSFESIERAVTSICERLRKQELPKPEQLKHILIQMLPHI